MRLEPEEVAPTMRRALRAGGNGVGMPRALRGYEHPRAKLARLAVRSFDAHPPAVFILGAGHDAPRLPESGAGPRGRIGERGVEVIASDRTSPRIGLFRR